MTETESARQRVAVVFDFDDTLLPDSTTAAIDSLGIDARRFWSEVVDPKVEAGWDPTLAWMDEFVRSPQFDAVTRSWLTGHGQRLESTLFPGVDSLFDGLRDHGERAGVEVSVHVVSSGLEDVITACRPVGQQADTVHACAFAYGNDGRPVAVKRALTFTEKTRCLFELSKGIRPDATSKSPYLVNERSSRFVVPFSNMVFVGDGLTDVPAFSLLNQHGGFPVGVNKAGKNHHLLDDNRVHGLADPNYRPGAPLRTLLEDAITTIAERNHPLAVAA